MDIKSTMLEVIDWYTRIEILFELIKQTKNREVVFIESIAREDGRKPAIRNLRVHTVQHFEEISKFIGLYKKCYNCYYSLATFRQGLPYQTLNMKERDNTEWNNTCWKDIIDFDMLIDFDCDNDKQCEEVKKDVIEVSNIFKDVPHSIAFSGCGFHITIESKYIPKPKNYPEWYNIEADINFFDLWYELLDKLKRTYGVIDKTICDTRRVSKLKYSLAIYDDSTYVCYPYFKHSEISEILIPQFTTSWILSSTSSIRNRGVPILNLERVNDADPSSAMRAVCKKLLGKKWDKYERLIS